MRLMSSLSSNSSSPALSPSPLTEHDPLGSSDYIQVYNHHQADQQEDCSDEIDSTTDLDDPFQNVSTPDSLAADFDSDTASHHHQHQQSHNNTLSDQPPHILTTTLDLKLNRHLQPESPTHQPNLQLDLSCVNSDDTDASITSLFSFPDPLNSIDQISPNARSDQYDSDWLERSPNRASELASSSPHSDHHPSLTSDQLDFNSSRSPSLTDGDLQSHTSFSSPTSPLFHTAAGSDLSHRLHVFLCGHQTSHSQSIEILSKLRMNFTQFDFLPPNPTLAPSRGPIGWKWPPLSHSRFRQAVSRALSDSVYSLGSVNNKNNNTGGDLMYQTSWLEITFSDLTALSGHDQRSFLSSSPEIPALIIHTTRSPDCFPTDWLNELSLACPGHLESFKVLPILLDENKSILRALVHGFQVWCGLNNPTDHIAAKSSVSEPLKTEQSAGPIGLLLQQDTPDSMDRLLRPHDLGMMSAPSVAKLHQLLVPFEPPPKPDQRNVDPSPPPSPPSSAGSKFLAMLACLVAIVAAAVLVIQPQALGHQSVLPTLSSVEPLRPLSTTERVNMTSETSGHPSITKEMSTTVAPTQAPRENSSTSSKQPTIFPTENLESTDGQKEMVGIEQAIGTVNSDEKVGSEHSSNQDQPILADPIEGEDGPKPARKRFLGTSKMIALPPVFERFRTARATRLLKGSSIYNRSTLKTLFSLTDDQRSSLFSALEDFELDPVQLRLWGKRLPPRVRKGLLNLRHQPKLCLKHLCRNSLPISSLLPSTCDLNHGN